jgi:nicotinamidase-related amidase
MTILRSGKSTLLVVDIQQKLLPAMAEPVYTESQATTLIKAADLTGVPVTISEQYPAGIGHTVQPVLDAAAKPKVFDKLHFDCSADPKIAAHLDKLKKTGRDHLVVCGIEAHVCVLQSALGFRARGYDVAAVVDAMSSRKALSKETAIARMAMAGISIVTTEMVVFEWLEKAGTPVFREGLKLIK